MADSGGTEVYGVSDHGVLCESATAFHPIEEDLSSPLKPNV